MERSVLGRSCRVVLITAVAAEKWGFPGGSAVKIRLPMQEARETWVQSLRPKDPQEKEMAIHSSILAWEIPWTEEPGKL